MRSCKILANFLYSLKIFRYCKDGAIEHSTIYENKPTSTSQFLITDFFNSKSPLITILLKIQTSELYIRLNLKLEAQSL